MSRLNRIEPLRGYSDSDVRAWLAPRRAHWRLGIENLGVDSNLGCMIRGHNGFAGGGIHIWGRRKYHKGVAMGTYNYEPIEYQPLIEDFDHPTACIAVEADTNLMPMDVALSLGLLPQDGEYWIGHDGLGLHPATIAAADYRVGPPTGWDETTSTATLGHLLMQTLRQGTAPTRPQLINCNKGLQASWMEGFENEPAAVQKELLPRRWWLDRWEWNNFRDWWLWMPNFNYGINEAGVYRAAQSAGMQGVISPNPTRDCPHWLQLPTETVIGWAHENDYKVYALELGGDILHHATPLLPERGILLLGNEQDGVDEQLQAQCDGVVSLMQYGSGRSFNVTMAASMATDFVPLTQSISTHSAPLFSAATE